MLDVSVHHHSIQIGRHFTVSFQRTLRIPDDDRTYPLPPGLGRFPVYRVADFAVRVPPAWNEHGGVFIPMYQREALWLSFDGHPWHPQAVKVGIGKVDAISGDQLQPGLGWTGKQQDYVVCPEQPWLDGINAGDGFIRQFVAMPLGMGYTVEGQVTGREEFGGIQLVVFDARPGRFPEEPPRTEYQEGRFGSISLCCCMEMGMGAGGRMEQKIYPDAYGVDTWDQENYGRVYVHIVNSLAFREITGLEPPSTPVSARLYTEYGYPWFSLYDEHLGDVKAPEGLTKVKSVKALDGEKGLPDPSEDAPLDVPQGQVLGLKLSPGKVADGKW